MATPILDALLASGAVFPEDGHLFIGVASDGSETTLPGSVARPELTENYLRDFPTPSHW